MTKVLTILMLAMSAITFFVYVYDKLQAKRGGFRVSEKTLLLLALAFGAPGALLAMYSVRHKTLKPKFTVSVPAFLVLQILACILL